MSASLGAWNSGSSGFGTIARVGARCRTCDRWFERDADLRSHTPKCPHCSREFETHHALEEHLYVPSLYFCGACCTDFGSFEALKAHVRPIEHYLKSIDEGRLVDDEVTSETARKHEQVIAYLNVIQSRRFERQQARMQREETGSERLGLDRLSGAAAVSRSSSGEHHDSASDSGSYLDGNVSNAETSSNSDVDVEMDASLMHTNSETSSIQENGTSVQDANEEMESDSETGAWAASGSESRFAGFTDSDSDSGMSQYSASSDFSEARRTQGQRTRTHSLLPDTEDTDENAVKLKCPLCWEERSNLSCGRCGHVFCTRCIREALSHRNDCPVCRDEMRRSELRRLFFAS